MAPGNVWSKSFAPPARQGPPNGKLEAGEALSAFLASGGGFDVCVHGAERAEGRNEEWRGSISVLPPTCSQT